MDFIINVLTAFALQIVFTVGIVVVFGLLIAFCNKRFYANFGIHARAVCYITGFIGTPVHELSHALFCVIFGHKIEEIKLFQINSSDGTLGYVKHNYNRRNIYQRIGNFFIGIAPILVISAILYAVAYFLLPAFVSEVNALSASVSTVSFTVLLKNIGTVVCSFFSLITTWQWWVFLLVGLFLALHMTLSGADIKGALSGLIFLLIIVLVMDIILAAIGGTVLATVTSAIVSAGSYLICFMIISLIISLILVALSFILGKIIK